MAGETKKLSSNALTPPPLILFPMSDQGLPIKVEEYTLGLGESLIQASSQPTCSHSPHKPQSEGCLSPLTSCARRCAERERESWLSASVATPHTHSTPLTHVWLRALPGLRFGWDGGRIDRASERINDYSNWHRCFEILSWLEKWRAS